MSREVLGIWLLGLADNCCAEITVIETLVIHVL